MNKWQPIATAPDGDRVLVFHPNHRGEGPSVYEAVTCLRNEGREWIASDPRYCEWEDAGVTHWMPIPAGPHGET